MTTMRCLRPAEHLDDRSSARWAFDAIVAALAVAVAMPDLFHDGEGPPWVAIAVLVAVLAPLAVRRILPPTWACSSRSTPSPRRNRDWRRWRRRPSSNSP